MCTSLKYLAANTVIKYEISYDSETLTADCIDIINKLKYNEGQKRELLRASVKNNDMDLINYILKIGNSFTSVDINLIAIYAAEIGNISVLRKLIGRKEIDLNWILKGAAKGGHIEIIEYLLEAGADHMSTWLVRAIEWNKLEVIHFAYKKGYISKNLSIHLGNIAKKYGHNDIVKYLKAI